MIRYIILRLAQAAAVLIGMSFLIYVLIGLMPGDPIDLMLSADPDVTPEDVARLKAIYGLDRPIIERYVAWLAAAVDGDFGYSRLFNAPVLEVLLPRLGNSLILMSLSLGLALSIALPAGIIAARNPGSLADRFINLACFAGISVPPFWFALLMILLFSVSLGWLPAGGMGNLDGGGFFDRVHHMILPVATLSIASIAAYARHMRAAMIEVRREDWVRTARAKGLSDQVVERRHALRNALLPVVTILALDFGGLFSGALITETMFSQLGMGKTIYDAILGNDYNLALVGLLLATLITLLANIAADIVYARLDPRITFVAEDGAG